jgi:cell division transport system permease protein
LLYGSEFLLRYFETRPQVITFFKQSVSEEKLRSIATEFQGKPYVESVKVITKEDALQKYRHEIEKDPLLLELVTADILPPSIEVRSKDIQSMDTIALDFGTYKDEVDEVVFEKGVVQALKKWTSALRTTGIGLAAVFGFTSFVVMMAIIAMKVAMRRNEISIMQLLGASGWYIFSPFFIEASLYGVMSVILGWGLAVTLLLYATPWLVEFMGTIPLLPLPPMLYMVQLGVGLIISLVLGFFSSVFALRRFIR